MMVLSLPLSLSYTHTRIHSLSLSLSTHTLSLSLHTYYLSLYTHILSLSLSLFQTHAPSPSLRSYRGETYHEGTPFRKERNQVVGFFLQGGGKGPEGGGVLIKYKDGGIISHEVKIEQFSQSQYTTAVCRTHPINLGPKILRPSPLYKAKKRKKKESMIFFFR